SRYERNAAWKSKDTPGDATLPVLPTPGKVTRSSSDMVSLLQGSWAVIAPGQTAAVLRGNIILRLDHQSGQAHSLRKISYRCRCTQVVRRLKVPSPVNKSATVHQGRSVTVQFEC
ncbi:hypothetical protein PoB_006565900, partial [Plakobranchus ocellatus]